MSTAKTRININISSEVKEILLKLAKKDQISITAKAEHLLELGLEMEEDEVWNKIATKREANNTHFRTVH